MDGLKLYRLFDTQRPRYLSGSFKEPGGKVTSFGLSSLASRHDPPGISSCTCPSPLYQPFDYHPPFVPLWPLTLDSPTSCLLSLLLGQAVPHLTPVHLLPQSASHIWQLSTSLPHPTTIYELHPAIPLPLSGHHSHSKTSRFWTSFALASFGIHDPT